jgi:hypothetical protein
MRIIRLHLEDVGPFDELDLALDSSWNSFVGDNGVGKSVILKAIAVGLCGRHSEPYAASLVRAGRASAKISLQTDQENYATQITLRGQRVEIVTSPRDPLQAEGWPALGFSPAWAITRDPMLPRHHYLMHRSPLLELLPLISGRPDLRFEQVKQWIIDLDRKGKANDGVSRRRLAKLFDLVNRLTSGQEIEFHGIDPVTETVQVRTSDGVVPIETVSHGTAVLFGLAGSLLHCLTETYTDAPDAELEFALVLIDDIDAHLHPAWQRSITSKLRGIFAAVQFISTTHSPLIAGSLLAKQLFHVHRASEGRISVEQLMVDFRGSRADDILTSPIFGLESTLDLQTQALMHRYTMLATSEILTPAEEQEFDVISQALKVTSPNKQTRREIRDTFILIQSTIYDQLKTMSDQDRRNLLNDINMSVLELTSGARLPR